MPITNKGRLWELINSLWIVFTLTLGFFSWVSFLYIAIRVRQKKWVLLSLVYCLPVMVFLFTLPSSSKYSTFSTILVGIVMLLCPVSLVNALIVRKEFLLRLEAQQLQKQEELQQLRNEIMDEYDVDVPEGGIATSEDVLKNQSKDFSEESTDVKVFEEKNNIDVNELQREIVDLNNCTESEITGLPGVGPIIAKKAVSLRKMKGGFNSVEEFGELLLLKPHVVERIKPLVKVTACEQEKKQSTAGRIIDY